MENIKQHFIKDAIAIVLLLVAAAVYFYPELQGKKY